MKATTSTMGLLLIFFLFTTYAQLVPALNFKDRSDNSSFGMCGNELDCGDRCQRIYKMFMKENGKSPWTARYPSIAKVWQDYDVKVSIEIGVARGGLSHYLLSTVGSLQVHHGIDTFSRSESIYAPAKRSSASMEWARAVLLHLSDFRCRFRLHKGLSTKMAAHFDLESVDSIYFDADHSFDGMTADIIAYARVLKPGGIMIFDDYDELDFYGVRKAIQNFANVNQLPIVKVNDEGNVMVVKPFHRLLNLTLIGN